MDRAYNPNAFRLAATPPSEDSHLVPGVEGTDAEAGEVLDVPRHEGKTVSRCCSADRRLCGPRPLPCEDHKSQRQ